MDAVLTAMNVHKWGIGCEWNVMMRHLIAEHGMWTMFVVKLAAGMFLLGLLYMVAEEKLAKWVTPVLFALIGAYGVIVFYGYVLLTA